MKLKSFFMMAIVALCSVACSDDDKIAPVADFVAGTYNGTLNLTVANNQVGASEISITLTKQTDASVSLAIINQETQSKGMSINRVEIDGVQVTDEGNGSYTLSKTIPEEGFTATDTGSANKIVWKFKAFSGHIQNGVLNLDMQAQPGAMPMPITMKFVSKK